MIKRSHKLSSIWTGVKAVLPHLIKGTRWVIGNGRDIHFWNDKWLHTFFLQRLQIQNSNLRARVSDIIDQMEYYTRF